MNKVRHILDELDLDYMQVEELFIVDNEDKSATYNSKTNKWLGNNFDEDGDDLINMIISLKINNKER